MSGVPGWSLTLPSAIGDLTLLPRNCRWNSDPNGILSSRIENKTTGGRRYRYKLFRENYLRFNFLFPQEENSQFSAIFTDTEDGNLPFYYVPDSSDMGTVLYVWYDDDKYQPQNSGAPGALSSPNVQMWFDWTLAIVTIVEDLEIDD